MGEGEPLDGVLYSPSGHISQPVLKLQQLLSKGNTDTRTQCVHTQINTHDGQAGTFAQEAGALPQQGDLSERVVKE